jgi:hypothetical protein
MGDRGSHIEVGDARQHDARLDAVAPGKASSAWQLSIRISVSVAKNKNGETASDGNEEWGRHGSADDSVPSPWPPSVAAVNGSATATEAIQDDDATGRSLMVVMRRSSCDTLESCCQVWVRRSVRDYR